MRWWRIGLAVLWLLGCTAPRVNPAPTQHASTGEAPLELTVAWGVTPIAASPASVVWLARDLGFYAAEGLDPDLQLIQGTPNLITGMRTGQIDVGLLTAYEAVLLTATNSLPMLMIGGSGATGQNNTFMVVSRTGLSKLEDLRGKSLAIARLGSYDDTLARQFLRARGIEPSDVQFLAIGEPNLRIQALIAGQTDSTLTSLSTWVSVRKQPGIKILASFEEVNAAVPSWPAGNVVTLQVARDKAEQLRRFTRAIIKASRFFANDRQAWVDAMLKRRPEMDPGDLGELWDQYRHAWAVNGGMNLGDYETGADLLYTTSPDFAQVPRIGLTQWADAEFVEGALRELGVQSGMDDPGRAVQSR